MRVERGSVVSLLSLVTNRQRSRIRLTRSRYVQSTPAATLDRHFRAISAGGSLTDCEGRYAVLRWFKEGQQQSDMNGKARCRST